MKIKYKISITVDMPRFPDKQYSDFLFTIEVDGEDDQSVEEEDQSIEDIEEYIQENLSIGVTRIEVDK